MNLQDLTLQQLKEIVEGAPDGATHVVDYAGMGKYDYLKNPDTWAAWYGSHWSMPGVLIDLSDKTIIKLSDIRAELESRADEELKQLAGESIETEQPASKAYSFTELPIDAVSDEMASSCAASDSAKNQAQMDLGGNKTDKITAQLNPAKCGKVNPSLAYDELGFDDMTIAHRSPACKCDTDVSQPAPMTDGELHAPVGQKHDQGKPRYSLIPSGSLEAIVDVLEYGANKYAPDNWKHVENARERYYNASMRHIQSWWSGEQNDPETGLPHLAHAVCSLMFLMALKGEQGE